MRSQTTRHLFEGCLAAGFAVLIMAAPAAAQSGQATQTQTIETAAATPAQIPTAPRVVQAPGPARPAHWSSNAGIELDTHDTGYGFMGPAYVKPIGPGTAFTLGGSVNYLYYDYPVGAGHTNVRSPGVNVMGGMRFGGTNYFQVSAGPGVKWRNVETIDGADRVTSSDDEVRVGLNLGADVYVDPTSHNNIYGMVRYGAEDSYTWGRLAFKEQITNRSWTGRFAHFVGAEVVAQGNEDVRSTQFGPFIEFSHVPSSTSISFRGGYKRTSYDSGPSKTGPWFAIGYWHRLR